MEDSEGKEAADLEIVNETLPEQESNTNLSMIKNEPSEDNIVDVKVEQEKKDKIEEATEGKCSLKSALQIFDEIDAEIGTCYIPTKSALQLLAEI